jgi:hypothetical protein
MPDNSHLDNKYFIDPYVYNCPFCNRRNVRYVLLYNQHSAFNWSENKLCYIYIAHCTSCEHDSLHLSFELLTTEGRDYAGLTTFKFKEDIDIDGSIFYHAPTSFFVLDNRIPEVLRTLITEAEGCLKMNYLTGASACTRKAIYELTILEQAQGASYEEKIDFLKSSYQSIDPELFNIMGHIQQMTSDKVHEQSWPKWDSNNLKLIIEVLKTVLQEIYVIPQEKKQRSNWILQLREKALNPKKAKPNPNNDPST